ncbi:TPA: AAA family ATPase [Yersinia enterocolitica]
MVTDSLEAEVRRFSESLPYWGKYLAEKILSGLLVSDDDIEKAYNYFLEEIKLLPETEKLNITIGDDHFECSSYKYDLILNNIEKVEGVNALVENQVIEFSPNLTIIYGGNGSGKSGYIRLLKEVFYTKSPGDIIKNIHVNSEHKETNAIFKFESSNEVKTLSVLNDKKNAEFKQYAVFDGESVFKHIGKKNEFEFRPAGLNFFSTFSLAAKKVEDKLNLNMLDKNSSYSLDDFLSIFEGDSEIKTLISRLVLDEKIDDLKKLIPFSEEDELKKKAIELKYDEHYLTVVNKEKDILRINEINKHLIQNKKEIESINKIFSLKNISEVQSLINDFQIKYKKSKLEGVEIFKEYNISNVGSDEWKSFIKSANNLAKINDEYPKEGMPCLFCNQPLPFEAIDLIDKYKAYIKSIAEEDMKRAKEAIDYQLSLFNRIDFDLFNDKSLLTIWLSENHPVILSTLKSNICSFQNYSVNIINCLNNKDTISLKDISISLEYHISLESLNNSHVQTLNENESSKKLVSINQEKIYYIHKEKLCLHFDKIENIFENFLWVKKAKNANFFKRKITDTEKTLSDKYFNKKYIQTFNHECTELDGDFGIEINHTGSSGKSYRQLKLKGNNPDSILSEGEQKVIAIADFLSETQHSEINRGIVFDDPVTSLDETRKSSIAKRLINQSSNKQVIIFTHDLVFVSILISHCQENNNKYQCHWIEKRNNNPGYIWLNNSPSYEREYRNADPARKIYAKVIKEDCEPAVRESLLKSGFTALRTCYEVLVINDLFKNVVQRYNERVSIDSLSKVCFDQQLVSELLDGFAQCCRYMEGHTHSDKYAYKKPDNSCFNYEIERYEGIKKKIKNFNK